MSKTCTQSQWTVKHEPINNEEISHRLIFLKIPADKIPAAVLKKFH